MGVAAHIQNGGLFVTVYICIKNFYISTRVYLKFFGHYDLNDL